MGYNHELETIEICIPKEYNRHEIAKIIAKALWRKLMEEKYGAAHCHLHPGIESGSSAEQRGITDQPGAKMPGVSGL